MLWNEMCLRNTIPLTDNKALKSYFSIHVNVAIKVTKILTYLTFEIALFVQYV